MNPKPCPMSMKFTVWTLEYLGYVCWKFGWDRFIPSKVKSLFKRVYLSRRVYSELYSIIYFHYTTPESNQLQNFKLTLTFIIHYSLWHKYKNTLLKCTPSWVRYLDNVTICQQEDGIGSLCSGHDAHFLQVLAEVHQVVSSGQSQLVQMTSGDVGSQLNCGRFSCSIQTHLKILRNKCLLQQTVIQNCQTVYCLFQLQLFYS